MRCFMKILSIDWDFFIDCSWEYRKLNFPPGGAENRSDETKNHLWSCCYKLSPELKQVGVKKDAYWWMKRSCKYWSKQKCAVSESHKDVYSFIRDNTRQSMLFELWSIDAHHDCYRNKKDDRIVTCGNWVRRLKHYRDFKYYWVGDHENSVTSSMHGDIEVIIKDLGDVPKDFDMVFLCRSDLWSPPHLDIFFDEVARLLKPDMDLQIRKIQEI